MYAAVVGVVYSSQYNEQKHGVYVRRDLCYSYAIYSFSRPKNVCFLKAGTRVILILMPCMYIHTRDLNCLLKISLSFIHQVRKNSSVNMNNTMALINKPILCESRRGDEFIVRLLKLPTGYIIPIAAKCIFYRF